MAVNEFVDGAFGPVVKAIVFYAVFLLRYVFFAGLAWLLVWRLFKDKLAHRRIQKREPNPRIVRREILWSLLTFAIFTAVAFTAMAANEAGYLKMYMHFKDHSVGYFAFSVFYVILFHDAYFYWSHRFMHWKPIYKHVHYIHHQSITPTPWAAFSFHPVEAVIEALVMPLASAFIPVHPLAIAIAMVYMTAMNVWGHLNYEFYPRGFTRHWLLGWSNTSTHHNMHHRFNTGNFGLYFNWWDRLCKTNQANYHEFYDKVTANPVVPVEAELSEERKPQVG